jgi:hypothetical protein
MANHKARVPRTMMKVPVSFRDSVMTKAHAAGMDATVYLEKCEVVRNDTE